MTLCLKATFAEILDDGLSGINVLRTGEDGPKNLLLSRVLMLAKTEEPVIQVN